MAAWACHVTASWETRTTPDPLRTDRPVTSCTEHEPPCHTGQTSNKRHWSEGERNRLSRAAWGAPTSPPAQLRGRDQRWDQAMGPPSLRLDAGLVEWRRATAQGPHGTASETVWTPSRPSRPLLSRPCPMSPLRHQSHDPCPGPGVRAHGVLDPVRTSPSPASTDPIAVLVRRPHVLRRAGRVPRTPPWLCSRVATADVRLIAQRVDGGVFDVHEK